MFRPSRGVSMFVLATFLVLAPGAWFHSPGFACSSPEDGVSVEPVGGGSETFSVDDFADHGNLVMRFPPWPDEEIEGPDPLLDPWRTMIGFADWLGQWFAAFACTPVFECDDGTVVDSLSDCPPEDRYLYTTGPECAAWWPRETYPVHKAEAVVRILDSNYVTTKNRVSFEVEVTGKYGQRLSNVPCYVHDHYESGNVVTRRSYSDEVDNRYEEAETTALRSLRVIQLPENVLHSQQMAMNSFVAQWTVYSKEGYDISFEAEFDIPELTNADDRTLAFKGGVYHWPNSDVTPKIFVEEPDPFVHR